MGHQTKAKELLKLEKLMIESLNNLSSLSPNLKASEMSPSGYAHEGGDIGKIHPLSVSLERAYGGIGGFHSIKKGGK